MAKTDTSYQGWKNYQTWNVALWLDNEQSTHSYWSDRAKYWSTKADSPIRNLADEIKESVEENNPLLDTPSMYQDILTASLQEVDWREIAEHYLGEHMAGGGMTKFWDKTKHLASKAGEHAKAGAKVIHAHAKKGAEKAHEKFKEKRHEWVLDYMDEFERENKSHLTPEASSTILIARSIMGEGTPPEKIKSMESQVATASWGTGAGKMAEGGDSARFAFYAKVEEILKKKYGFSQEQIEDDFDIDTYDQYWGIYSPEETAKELSKMGKGGEIINGVQGVMVNGNAIDYHELKRIETGSPLGGDYFVDGDYGYAQSGYGWFKFKIKDLKKKKMSKGGSVKGASGIDWLITGNTL